MRRLMLLLAAIPLGYAYLIAFTYAAGAAAAQATPAWWLGFFGKSGRSALIWLTLLHLVAIALVSLPFAWIISRLYGRLGVFVAFGVTATICAAVEIPAMYGNFPTRGLLLQSIWLFGALMLLVTLPVGVWGLRKWPSNNRWRGP